MGLYNDHVLPRIMSCAMGMSFIGEERKKCLSEVRGQVLEIGFGAGHNLPYYPSSVEKVTAVDPSVVSAKLARKRILMAPFPVEYIPLEGEKISVPDASFDSVVSTFTLCTIPDVASALRQVRRVLKPDGRLFFVEHGRSSEPGVQRWQDRLNRFQKRFCGGCNLNRDIEQLILSTGFQIVSLEKYYGKGPRVSAQLYRGSARRHPNPWEI
jgi:ubiquinone/menaquinone biosynthesis C-methylase UbiE